MPDSHAGRRRPEARAHRLHGVEGSRQRARPAPDLPPAGQRARASKAIWRSSRKPTSWTSRPGAASRRISPAGGFPSNTRARFRSMNAPMRRNCSSRLLRLTPAVPICRRPRSRERSAPAPCSTAGPKKPCASLPSASKTAFRRYFATRAEDAVLGGIGNNRMRRVSVADSALVAYSGMKVYLLRTSTLVARGAGRFELGWKSAARLGRRQARRRQHSVVRRDGRSRNRLRRHVARAIRGRPRQNVPGRPTVTPRGRSNAIANTPSAPA